MSVSLAVKTQLKKVLNDSQRQALKRSYLRPYSYLYRKNLSKLALAFRTDKEGPHHYAERYQYHFEPPRRKRIHLLEIGVGGYEDPRNGGQSLRMWKAYFRKGRIFGIDIYDKSYHDEHRVKTFRGTQGTQEFRT